VVYASIENSGVQEFESDNLGFSMTASDILEHLFCPRFTYFQSYLQIPQHEEKRFKVQKGRTVHENKVHATNF